MENESNVFEKRFIVIGHRGASGHKLENSFSSFSSAVESGVDAVELDVWICKTGEAIVIHDDTVDRVANGTGRVADKTLAEIKSLKLKNGEEIPTLEEVLKSINGRAGVNIEIKDELAVAPVAEIIKKSLAGGSWSVDMFLVSSFDASCLLPLKKKIQELKIGALTEETPIDYGFVSGKTGFFSLGISTEIADEKTIKEAEENGLRVFVFTVNDFASAERMKKIGAGGIFSDFPDRFLKLQN